MGSAVCYSKHHKHTFYLIANGDIPGFSDRERGLVALVARYHRRSPPDRERPDLAVLRPGRLPHGAQARDAAPARRLLRPEPPPARPGVRAQGVAAGRSVSPSGRASRSTSRSGTPSARRRSSGQVFGRRLETLGPKGTPGGTWPLGVPCARPRRFSRMSEDSGRSHPPFSPAARPVSLK